MQLYFFFYDEHRTGILGQSVEMGQTFANFRCVRDNGIVIRENYLGSTYEFKAECRNATCNYALHKMSITEFRCFLFVLVGGVTVICF